MAAPLARLPLPVTRQPRETPRSARRATAPARILRPIPGRAAASRLRRGERRAPRGRRPQLAPARRLLPSDWLLPPRDATVQFSLSLPPIFASCGRGVLLPGSSVSQ